MYIPEGYGTVFPYFMVSDVGGFINFLENVFEAVEIGRTVTPAGRLANARIRIGTSSFMVSEADSSRFGPTTASYYVYVENADETFAKAMAHGATKLMEPMDMPYQDRQGGIKDPCGNTWWISTRLVPGTYD